MPQPTRPSTSQSITTTVILVFVILLSLFPSLFHLVVYAPIRLISPTAYVRSHQVPTHPPIMSWAQKTFTLPTKSRGSYLVTDEVVKNLPELKNYKVGLLNLFIQHTSCALSLNENWDSDVREDMSDALDRIAPEDRKGDLYRHSAEGLDDMPVSRSLANPIFAQKLIVARHISRAP